MKNPADDPLQNVTNYIPADRWFDNFRSAYITEWNRLDKN
jgi:hypothetical protein